MSGTSLTKKTSKDRDLNLCQISNENMWPVIYSINAVVQRFDNMTISLTQSVITIIIYFSPIDLARVTILGFYYKQKHILSVLSALLCP